MESAEKRTNLPATGQGNAASGGGVSDAQVARAFSPVQVSSGTGGGTRITVLLALLAVAGVVLYFQRPDLALQRHDAAAKKGPRTAGAHGEGVDWSSMECSHFLQGLTASDWFLAFHCTDSNQIGGKSEGEKPSTLNRIVGFEANPADIESIHGVWSVSGVTVVVQWKKELPEEQFKLAWQPSGNSHYGVEIFKSAKPDGMFAGYALLPHRRCFVSGTSVGSLQRTIAAAVGRQYGVPESAWPKNQSCIVLNDMRFLASPLQAVPMSGGGAGGSGGVLSGIRPQFWFREIAGGEMVLQPESRIAMRVVAKDDETSAKVKEDVARVLRDHIGKRVIEPEKAIDGLKVDKNAVVGTLQLQVAFADVVAGLIDSAIGRK